MARKIKEVTEEVRTEEENPTITQKDMYIRAGSKRHGIYSILLNRPGEAIPEAELNPSQVGTAYAVKKLNEKLVKAGDIWEIRKSKDNKIVSYGLYQKAGN